MCFAALGFGCKRICGRADAFDSQAQLIDESTHEQAQGSSRTQNVAQGIRANSSNHNSTGGTLRRVDFGVNQVLLETGLHTASREMFFFSNGWENVRASRWPWTLVRQEAQHEIALRDFQENCQPDATCIIDMLQCTRRVNSPSQHIATSKRGRSAPRPQHHGSTWCMLEAHLHGKTKSHGALQPWGTKRVHQGVRQASAIYQQTSAFRETSLRASTVLFV